MATAIAVANSGATEEAEAVEEVMIQVRVRATARRTLKRNPHFDPELHLFNYISILWLKALKLELYIN